MSKVNEFADRVAGNYKLDVGEAAFDPTIILVFAELLIPLIQELQKCIAAKNVPKVALAPSPVQSLVFRLKLRNLLVNNGEMTLREFRSMAGNFTDALRKSTAELTVEEVEELYAEV